MKTIKHIPLAIEPIQTIEIPWNSEFLRFGTWDNKPMLYMLCDSGQKPVKRKFLVFAENKDVPTSFNRTNYIGSFEYQAEVGSAVLHVFEE